MPFAVKVGAVAMPFAPVMAVADATPPGNVPVAPDAGAVKVTVAPLSGWPPWSTVTCNEEEVVLIGTHCDVPEITEMELPDDARFTTKVTCAVAVV